MTDAIHNTVPDISVSNLLCKEVNPRTCWLLPHKNRTLVTTVYNSTVCGDKVVYFYTYASC